MKNSGYHGINGSFYNVSTDQALLNITMNNGATVGNGKASDGRSYGTVNYVGRGLIAWNGSALTHYTNVTNASEVSFLSKAGTWGQGGIAMHLGNRNWESEVENQGASQYVSVSRQRSAMVMNRNTNEVYLIMVADLVTFGGFRDHIQQYLNITDGAADNSTYKGIMLDGGTSSQIRGVDLFGNSVDWPFTQTRKLASIVALKNI